MQLNLKSEVIRAKVHKMNILSNLAFNNSKI